MNYSELRNEIKEDFAEFWAVPCEGCDEVADLHDLVEFEDSLYCQQCLKDDGIHFCDHCGIYHQNTTIHHYLYHGQPRVCHYCPPCVNLMDQEEPGWNDSIRECASE